MLSVLLCAALGVCPIHAEAPVTAFAGATVIDGTGAPPLPDVVLLVRDKRVLAVGRRGAVSIPPDARMVDISGKWLLPGLIDMHVHLDEDISPGAYVLFGVTSVRDVGSRLVSLQQLRARAAKGELLPRLYWMGRNIDQGKPSWWGAVAVKEAAGVPAMLDNMARQGVDGVKLYVRAGPDVSRAVIRDAHKRGWPVTGHLQDTRPSQAARMGIDNLEHVSTLFEELRQKPKQGPKGFGAAFQGVPEVDLNSPRARALVRTLASNGVAVTATLVTAVMPVEGEQGADKVYSGWAMVPTGWRSFWKMPYWDFIAPKGWSERDYRTARQAREKYRQMVRLLDRAGERILAGTDSPAPWVLPGAGLLVELEELVKCGLTPMRAIQAATGRAAEVLRRAEDVGTIRPGRYADFLVVDADPLKDIRNLREIHAVYLAGRKVNREDLRKAFESAKRPPKMP